MLPVVIYLKVRSYVCHMRYCGLQSLCTVTYSCNNDYGALVEWYWQGETEVVGEKPLLVSINTPRIPHGLAWDSVSALGPTC